MAIWLFRGGRNGEYEAKFLEDNKVYLTWSGLDIDLSTINEKQELSQVLTEKYPNENKNKLRNWVGQIWPIAQSVEIGDWVVLPSKFSSVVHIGEITDDYEYDHEGGDRYHHSRAVNWFAQDIPRTAFEQDILYSFGAFMTVCRISRNNAETRIKNVVNRLRSGLQEPPAEIVTDQFANETVEDADLNLEDIAYTQIAEVLNQRFAGHKMAELIEGILQTKGYVTHLSPPGPDFGIDILAAAGKLGFETPRICVQVKTGDSPVDRPTLDQLLGTMHNVSAEQGLLVSWNGFKRSVEQERAKHFFKVRLWSQKEIIDELLQCYHKLPADLKIDLPLKQIWVLSSPDN
jgi:restriction system protein